MILKELIEREIDQYLEWPTADRSHVTTVSAKLFAEHVARLYADHIADARKKVSRPQIREVFLRNGAKIEPDRDDLPDWIYESVFELLEMGAPAERGEPDVSALVEALEAAQKEAVRGINHARNGAQAAAALGRASAICGAALAAHRKQEPSHDNR